MRRTEHSFSSSFHFIFVVNYVLSLFCRGLSWESDKCNFVLIFDKFFMNDVFDVKWFPCSCWPNKKCWNLVFDICLKDVLISNFINSRHNDVLRSHILWEFAILCFNVLSPWFPNILNRQVAPVINWVSVREGCFLVLKLCSFLHISDANLFEFLIYLDSEVSSASAA